MGISTLHVAPMAAVLLLAAVGCIAALPVSADTQPTTRPTFTNPIITSQDSPDPWVVRHDGWYYFTATLDPSGGVWIWKSKTLTGLDDGEKVKVWVAPKDGPTSHGIWAPELFRFDGRWYVYFTATDGPDEHHRHYVMESQGDDPLGPYGEPTLLDPELDRFAIDGTVLEMPDDRRYFAYSSGKLEMVEMTSPTTVNPEHRATIAEADRVWERHWVEAPEALIHDGRVMLVYSAGHSGTPHYVLGLLTLTGNDPLAPGAWSKYPEPVLTPYVGRDGAIYTTGHNGFTVSPDGTEHWLVFHGKDWRDTNVQGFHGRRTQIQPFTFTDDGRPDFGHAIPPGVPLPLPSGEKAQ